jgi:hypothetical protein
MIVMKDRLLKARRLAVRPAAGLLICLGWCLGPWTPAHADDITDLKRAMEALLTENRALARRIAALEAAQLDGPLYAPPAATPATGQGGRQAPQAGAGGPRLEQRVTDLESAKIAQEDAVRSIVRDTFSKLGSNINQSVSLGGVLEVVASRTRDFAGESRDMVGLGTAELVFEVQANPWTLGNLTVQYTDGTNVLFPTTNGFQSGVDRFTLDQGFITVGNTQRFPAFVNAGRVVLPFGISTGHPVADVLSSENPLTIEAFETKKTALGFGLEFPTPAPGPAAPPVVVPPVRPLALNPFIGSAARRLGYQPLPARPTPLLPGTPAPAPPPFHAALYFYQGDTIRAGASAPRLADHYNVSAGYRAGGHCGRAYDALRDSYLCPWSLAVDVSYNSSVFDSQFLEAEYRPFFSQIGLVRGMALSVKSTLGAMSLVGEWNGALRRASFVDDVRNRISIRPAAWQVSLGYQFGWNPWVEEIGAQGTYIAIGYSKSRDLMGVTRVVNGEPARVGFVPSKRLILTAGEWVADGLRLAIEYSRNWDYEVHEGGTGKSADGLFTTLTYSF